MVLIHLLVLLMAHGSALAQDCATVKADLAEASPQSCARLFADLAECDPAAARSQARSVLPRVLSGEDGYNAARAAVQVGASDAAVAWIDTLQSDERAPAIRTLGVACNKSEMVQQFFVDRAKEMGDEFWTQRWYRGLADCHVESVQEILWVELDKGLSGDRSRFFGVLESYARSAAINAVPRLESLVTRIDDQEAQTYIVNAFADAAQVGSLDGMDVQAAEAAIAAIIRVAPSLAPRAVEQARRTLESLGDEQQADLLAGVRYAATKQEDGSIHWGTLILESATCKNGKTQQRAHVARVIDQGQTWQDQLVDKITASAETVWSLDLAERCKGEGGYEVLIPDAPFADKAAFDQWVKATIIAKRDEEAKWTRVDQDEVAL